MPIPDTTNKSDKTTEDERPKTEPITPAVTEEQTDADYSTNPSAKKE